MSLRNMAMLAFKMGLNVKIALEMAVQDPKVENSGWWHLLEFLRHLEVSFFSFFWSRLPKYVIRSNLNPIAHEMTIELPLFCEATQFSLFLKNSIYRFSLYMSTSYFPPFQIIFANIFFENRKLLS
jgi:hypothetical protein